MCLYISRFWHAKDPKPKIAKRDICVYKILLYSNGIYKTPFQKDYTFFSEGINVKTSNLAQSLYLYNGDVTPIITIGIHAYRTSYIANKIRDYLILHIEGWYITHYAIIPKGAEYYIGRNKEIVSNELIIFETKDDYKQYKKSKK